MPHFFQPTITLGDVVVFLAVLLLALERFGRGGRVQRRRTLLAQLADEGIALSEQMARFQRANNPAKTALPTAHDKAMVAVGHMRARADELRVKVTDAELRKVMEIRLHDYVSPKS